VNAPTPDLKRFRRSVTDQTDLGRMAHVAWCKLRSVTAVLLDQTHPGIVQITLNRPERLNAMNAELVAGLHDALDRVAADRSCRAVVLTGAGRGFCAGLDLQEGATPDSASGLGRVQAGMQVQKSIASLIPHMRSVPQPIVSAVNGAASGGGLALALGSDVRVAAQSARFNVAFIRVGLSGCDIGVSWMLPRLVGASRAFELLLTGRLIDAEEAHRIGLVVRVVPDGEVLDAALETAELIAGNSPWGVRMTKEVMWSQLEIGSLQAGIDMENRTQVLSSFTGDMQEAMAAFLEKRPPSFENQ
jgi:enoyl-CoA hydratase